MPYEGLTAETIKIKAHNSDEVEAYVAKPAGNARRGGVVVIHHAPGWDEWTTEVVRRFAHHGYDAISPHLYSRAGGISDPGDMAAMMRAMGGVSDDQAIGDVEAGMKYLRALPTSNGKVGIIGFCSGGRHVYLAAGRLQGVDAAVDCWGGGVIVADPANLTPARPVAPIDYTPKITAPLLGIFGNEDRNPDVDQVNKTEEELKKHGKVYEFHRYDGAGHGFFASDRAGYRPEQATDGWKRVFDWYEKYLA
jgi:carboxymethylenebutenolidase